MGKYMKKSKVAGDIAVTELSQSTTFGVRTRAKTLALQRLHSPSPADTSSYLQLRSRRLEKHTFFKETKKPQLLEEAEHNHDTSSDKKMNSKAGSKMSKSSLQVDSDCEEECFSNKGEMLDYKCEAEDLGGEASFEPRERSTREKHPMQFSKDSDTIGTPGSTRQTSLTVTNRRVRNNIPRNIPTTHEMEEFFTCAEQEQQRLFVEKYNFDVVNDLPLPGRYEWVQVIS